jgi:BTB/POZ domain-containing protein 13
MDVELVLHDNIIPHSWLNPVVLQQWKQVLRVNQNDDKGYDFCTVKYYFIFLHFFSPREVLNEIFLETSLRCGRILLVNERHVWRWTGFHFGMDLLMVTDGFTLSVKRNHRSEFEQLLSFQTLRHVAIRYIIGTIDNSRHVTVIMSLTQSFISE